MDSVIALEVHRDAFAVSPQVTHDANLLTVSLTEDVDLSRNVI